MAQLLAGSSDAKHIHSKKKVVQNGGALHHLPYTKTYLSITMIEGQAGAGAGALLFYFCAGRAPTAVVRFTGCCCVFYNLAELQKLCYIM